MKLREIAWPLLERDEQQEALAAEHAKLELERIAVASWPPAERETALSESRRVADAEAGRHKSSDDKASIYLAAVSAAVPLLASSETVFWDNNLAVAPRGLAVPLLLLALAYLTAAGFWSAQSLRVSGSQRVDVEDLTGAERDLSVHLARGNMRAALLNRKATNDKVSSLKMAHEFILRAAVLLLLLLGLEIGWRFACELLSKLHL